MSWRLNKDRNYCKPLEKQIKYADSLGIVLISSAANDNENLDFINSYPAKYEEVAAIASTDFNDLKSSFSNYGSSIEVCAPGGVGGYDHSPENIYSTLPMNPGFYLNVHYSVYSEYDYLGGTSMSSPFVAGLASLIKSYDFNLSANEILNIISGTADPIDEQFHELYAGKLGAGRINAFAALSALQRGFSSPNIIYYGSEISAVGEDGAINPGDNVDLTVKLKNFWMDAFNVIAVLSSEVMLGGPVTAAGVNILNGEIGNADFNFTVKSDILPGEHAFQMHLECENYTKDFTFYLYIYDKTISGFPLNLGEPVQPKPKIADLDGDGDKEMVVISNSGNIYIITGAGQIEHTISTGNAELISEPALGDMDADGDLELVIISEDGNLYAFHHNGIPMISFPVNLENDFDSSPVLGDMDGDRDLEIVVCGKDNTRNNIFCLESDGSINWPPITSDLGINYSPAVGDYDADGNDDLFCLTGTDNVVGAKLVVYSGLDGHELKWSQLFAGREPLSMPTIGYLDESDSWYDVIFRTNKQSESNLVCLILDGFNFLQIGFPSSNHTISTPITNYIGAVAGLEYLIPSSKSIFLYDHTCSQINKEKVNIPDFEPFQIITGDLNDDGNTELLALSENYIVMLKNDLEISNEFRVKNDYAQFTYAPIISDFNNNGLIDVSLISKNGDIYVYEWNSPYKSNKMEWPEAQRDIFNSKRYDPPALSGELTGNTTWSGIVRVSGDIIIPQSTTLTIDPGTRIIFQHGDDEKDGESEVMPELIVRGTLNVNGTVNNLVEMYSYSKWHGIVVDPYGTINLDYCFIDRAEKGVYVKANTEPGGSAIIIENCKISRSDFGIYAVENTVEVHDCDIHDNNYAVYMLSANVEILRNQINNNETGVYLYESQFDISVNTIENNHNYGIYLSHSSDGSVVNNNIYENSINDAESEYPFSAVFLYSSSPSLYQNQIYSNYKNGILLMNNSFPVIQENNLIENNGPFEQSNEPDWEKAEILCHDQSAPFMSYGHNDIIDNRPYAGYLMMHAGEIDEPIDVSGNYWGGSSPAGRLYPEEYFIYRDCDPEENTTGDPSGRDGEEQLYVDGLAAEEQGDYSLAKTKYNQIISQYPDSIETAYALPRLIICEKELGGDLLQLEIFYTTFSQNISDSVKSKVAYNLSLRCEVQQMLYNDAIVGYEQIVQSPSVLADSIYAIIDIGDVYLLKDELANSGSLPKINSNSLPENTELKPENQKKFDKKKKELLSLLYRNSKLGKKDQIPKTYALSQNYPNPFNPVTTIKYQLPKASKVKLDVFNILGQKVKTLADEQKEAAYYELQWDGKNDLGNQTASGVYVYRLFAEALNGKEKFVKTKKMLLIR